MTRPSQFNSPFLLGFEGMERLLDRVSKAGDGYPPYNIERVSPASPDSGAAEAYRVVLAVAGFSADDLSVTLEDRQLLICGRQTDDRERQYLHRGIAARQFQRSFLVADGVEVTGAELTNGLLTIDFVRRVPQKHVERIEIGKGAQGKSRPVPLSTNSSTASKSS